MADALLEVVLTDLSSLIKGELGLVIGFKKEFEKLSSTFSTIQCVLEDAQMKQLNDKALENWLKKLNAAYEVDDIVDECKTEAIRFKQSRLRSSSRDYDFPLQDGENNERSEGETRLHSRGKKKVSFARGDC